MDSSSFDFCTNVVVGKRPFISRFIVETRVPKADNIPSDVAFASFESFHVWHVFTVQYIFGCDPFARVHEVTLRHNVLLLNSSVSSESLSGIDSGIATSALPYGVGIALPLLKAKWSAFVVVG